ncbi:MAG: hypothetical protein ACERK0_10250, partial [Deltaproteobacteria bacterium]
IAWIMSVLASLLVRDKVIPVDRVQEVIQEQVIRGGNLDTVLLELECLRENEMNAYCAAVYGLLPATRDEVMQTPISTIRVLPREFAVRHRLIPVARTEDAVVLVVDRREQDRERVTILEAHAAAIADLEDALDFLVERVFVPVLRFAGVVTQAVGRLVRDLSIGFFAHAR